MFHMIIDNLEAYVNARIDLALHTHTEPGLEAKDDWDEYRSLKETASTRNDGLVSIIRMAIQEAAAEPPHNPFSINGDVNQPEVKFICANGQLNPEDNQPDHNEHGTFPPPPRRDQ